MHVRDPPHQITSSLVDGHGAQKPLLARQLQCQLPGFFLSRRSSEEAQHDEQQNESDRHAENADDERPVRRVHLCLSFLKQSQVIQLRWDRRGRRRGWRWQR
eukprot:scaffold14707_cov129-Isochrysis_galbana.AAC.9